MNNYQLTQSKVKSKYAVFLLFIVLCLTMQAQNVTISPASGKLVAGLTSGNEIGFSSGWNSLWRHNQLPLTLTVSDASDLTEGGQLKAPAGDIILDTSQNLYAIGSGSQVSAHINISLPKGFRFTGYRMVWVNNCNNKKWIRLQNGNMAQNKPMNKRVYETNSTFDKNSPLASTQTMGSVNETKEYVIERTSKPGTDMGNNLYFFFDHEKEGFYAATLKSCELYFTAEGMFEAQVAPGNPTQIISNGVNMVGSPFYTSKLDLGELKLNTKFGQAYYSYDFNNVQELAANNWLYQEDAVSAGKLPDSSGSGSIQALKNGNKYYYALGNNTYYIETPIKTKSQNGTDIPLGYRIVGARIKYHYGVATPLGWVNPQTGDPQSLQGTIKANNSYLGTGATWKWRKTTWEYTSERKLKSGKYYLTVNQSNNQYYVNYTSNASEAATFSIVGNRIKYGSLFMTRTSYKNPQMSTTEDNAVTWNQNSTSLVENPAFTPSPYTLKVYGTDGNTVKTTVTVGDGDDNTIQLTNLNNDAIKFQIEGLAPNAKALITFELELEALNPFINSMDIVCTSHKDGQRLIQQFTSNDFQVSGGAFVFYVPTDFIGEGYNNCKFTFENLTSKYMDNTYGLGTDRHARNYFVKSPYYNTYGDGAQYNATGNESYGTKVMTQMCGDQPFRYSNIDQLGNTSGSTTSTTLEEYPYSEDAYMHNQTPAGTFTDDIEIELDHQKKCYLFTGDETRWNIAPTKAMEHRNYAYYLMDLTLTMKDYEARCELTKLYDSTCYNLNGSDSEKPMYGGTFKAYSKEPPYQEIESTKAYLTVNMMQQALRNKLEEVGANTNQILYLDYTNLYSVQTVGAADMAAMKSLLNPNCLIFFPARTSYNEDNYIQKTLSGDYRACKNIVIADRQPFYTPYKITVPSENYATYTREITIPKNGKVANATVILPFTLDLEGGTHTNRDNLCSFSVYKMNANNCLSIDQESSTSASNYIGNAYFSPLTASKTEANVPYMVKVETAPTDNTISFIATQYGSDVMPTKDSNMGSDYTFIGETATGSIAGNNYSFTNYGSYSGKKIDKVNNIFYFSGNMYLNSKNLRDPLQYIYVYPFRCYYGYSGSAGAKIMNAFNVLYGENNSTTSIDEVTEKPDLAVIAENGTLTFMTTKDQLIQVFNTNGASVSRFSMKAGDIHTIELPAGVYIVNGKKIIIK